LNDLEVTDVFERHFLYLINSEK